MKRNVNISLLALLLFSLLANIVLIFLVQEKLDQTREDFDSTFAEFNSSYLTCVDNKLTYKQRLVEVAENCRLIVYQAENKTMYEYMDWSRDYVENITNMNRVYRQRLQECNQKVIGLINDKCI